MIAPSGLLVIDKPLGWSSMKVCAVVRSKLRRGGAAKRIKVGHAGTLDPLATGVLVVLVGAMTKQQDREMAGRKRYTAEVDLGHRSPTDDAEGPVEPVDCLPVPLTTLEAALPMFLGRVMQRPPAFSAVKIAGRRAYDIARHAPEALPSPEPRPVLIESIAMLSYDWPLLHLDIACGKGTYIRSLARDLGAALGAGGMLRSLVRTRVGPWTIDQAARPEALPDPLTQAHLLRPADAPAGP